MKFSDHIRTGMVRGVYNSIHSVEVKREDRPDYLHTKEVDELTLDFGGIVGNRHYGITRPAEGRTRAMYIPGSVEIRNNAQWSMVSQEDLNTINSNLELDENDIQAPHIGSNILVEGIDNFTLTPRGYYLAFTNKPIYEMGDVNQVVLIVHGEVNPCNLAGKGAELGSGRANITNRFPKAANRLRGLRGWVEKGGVIKPGMYIHVLQPTGRT